MASSATLATNSTRAGPASPETALRGRPAADSDAGLPLLDVRGVTIQYKTQAHLITATYRVSFNVCRATATWCWGRRAAASRHC